MGLKESDVKVGDTSTQVVPKPHPHPDRQYAGASGDYNPLHSDEVFTTKVAGYPTVFAHGMLTMGTTGGLLTDWVGDDAHVLRRALHGPGVARRHATGPRR